MTSLPPADGRGPRLGPAPETTVTRLCLAGILAVGAGLRFWNVGTGLPYRIGVDEPILAERAVAILRSGDFNPYFFEYPAFAIYVHAAVAILRFLTGAMDGHWSHVREFWADDVFLWTRSLSAILGTVTIVLVYRVGLRWRRSVALLAAALLAVWMHHVRESHFALTDVPLTLLITCALLASLRAHETGRLPWFVAAGASVGLAAATKYNGAVGLVMPLLAAALTLSPARPRLTLVATSVAAAGAAFLLGAPYTLLDLPGFLNGFGLLSQSYPPRPFMSGASNYLGIVRLAVGWPALVALVAGGVWAVVRALGGRHAGRWAIASVFPALYFYLVSTKGLMFSRYLLPALPFFALLIAAAVVDLLRWLATRPRLARSARLRTAVTVIVLVVVLFQPVRMGVRWVVQYAKPVTADAAYRLIRHTIPDGAKVAVEGSVLRLPDRLYRSLHSVRFTDGSFEEYADEEVEYYVATSSVYGPVLANPRRYPESYAAYRKLFDQPGACQPVVSPTDSISGPEIRICRLPGN
jgi:4-amino-4-deoxy-L-arabinose transferase-like glycosyltransferase